MRNRLPRQPKNLRARLSAASTDGTDGRSWIAWRRTQDLVELGYVSARTARSWRQKRRLPAWAAGWIQLIANGDLGRIDTAWAQWQLCRGEIISPDGWSFRPAEVATIAFRNQKIRFLEDDLERLTADHRRLQALILAWVEYLQQHGLAPPPALQVELQKLLPKRLKLTPR
ncbi:MAG TPA: DUF3653 domain-containing protein [Povalibacter sp.]|nr:DUF3653 domain-containing protein [Povalibacter sp.]